MDSPIWREDCRIVGELPGRVTSLKAEGDVLKIETVAGDFVLTQDGRLLHMAGQGRA